MTIGFGHMRRTCPTSHSVWRIEVPTVDSFSSIRAGRILSQSISGALERNKSTVHNTPHYPMLSQPMSMCAYMPSFAMPSVSSSAR